MESDARIKLQQQVGAGFSARRDLRTEFFSPKTVKELRKIYRRLLKAYAHFSFNILLKNIFFSVMITDLSEQRFYQGFLHTD
jgi:hypothetical protein